MIELYKRRKEGVCFVVRAYLPGVARVWVSNHIADGSRTLVSRDAAANFPTPSEAQTAIEELPWMFRARDVVYSIEPAQPTSRNGSDAA